jgi:hypothetical protein
MVKRMRGARRTTVAILLLLAFAAANVRAAEYYVAPTGGSDSNPGSIGSPFATFTKAIAAANAGDTIFARGGTYNINTKVTIQKAGTAANPIKLFAYPGETPILDFATNPATAGTTAGRGFELNGNANWWHIKGLTIQNAKDNGFYTEGANGIFEQIVTRNNRDSGFQLHGMAANNLVLNCDSYENFDLQTLGENADGFAVKHENIGPGNIFRGNRAWGNSDDGWDTYYAVSNGVMIDNSWAFDNGFNTWGISNFAGDGTGYKLGEPGGDHVLLNVLAIDNAGHGIDINQNGTGVEVYNSTSFSNNKANWYFDEDSNETINQHVLKNNVSLSGGSSDRFDTGVDHSFNTWNGSAFAVSAADFLSTARTVSLVDLLKQPRLADGSLPDLGDFLHLAPGSDLINAGTPISFTFGGVNYNVPFNGNAPDLGAYETGVAAPTLPGDYNGDDVVDAADYVAWRDAMGTTLTLVNDETPGSVDDTDYDVWKSNFGQTLTGGGSLGSNAVPEPASIAMLLIATSIYAARRRRYESASRWTVLGAKAGRHTAMYSAPSASGVL